jgi:hypothetical protein
VADDEFARLLSKIAGDLFHRFVNGARIDPDLDAAVVLDGDIAVAAGTVELVADRLKVDVA